MSTQVRTSQEWYSQTIKTVQTIVALICTVGKAIFRYIFSIFIVFFYGLRLRRLKAIALKFVSRIVATFSFSFYHKIS